MHFNSLLVFSYILYLDAFFNQMQWQKQTQETYKKYRTKKHSRETLKCIIERRMRDKREEIQREW